MILFRARVSVLGTAAAAVPFPSFLLLLPLVLDLFFGSCSPCSVSTYYLRLSCGPFTSSRIRNEEIASVQLLDFPSALYYSPGERNSFFRATEKKRRHENDDSLSRNSIDPLRELFLFY